MFNKLLNNPLLRRSLFTFLLLACTATAGFFATRYHLQRDVTFTASNSLSPASVDVLAKLNQPVNITVYATLQDARLGDIRKIIGGIVSLYQRYKSDVNLVFIDPEQEPEKTRDANIQLNGEMVIEYQGRSEHLSQINEQVITSTLLRLAHTQSQAVMFLSGHGERQLDGIANFDLGAPFGAKLKQNGYSLSPLNLALAQAVPSNISTLVITQPQVDLLPGEVDKLQSYIAQGGNLLWLIDAEPLHGLERLAEQLDLVLPPGSVIDPTAAELRAPATWAIAAAYTPHAITQNFNLITAFPKARALTWNESSDWQRHTLIETSSRAWLSRSGKGNFDKAHDTPGPVTLASALQRHINDRDQRIVVVGNGAFLANSFAGNGGNVDMGVNMLNWLAGEEHLITVQPRSGKDSNLNLSKNQMGAIGISFLLVLPLLLAGWGGWLWWKRRRA
jgi:ABC-type uncharacterized transport system involved in gliding motility auxiliary subunit